MGTPMNHQKVQLWEYDDGGSTDDHIADGWTNEQGYVDIGGRDWDTSGDIEPYLYAQHSCNVPTGCDACTYHGDVFESKYVCHSPCTDAQIYKVNLPLDKYPCGCFRFPDPSRGHIRLNNTGPLRK
ncbi:transthyretin-like family domain-containing protein [Ditylenchus destructor]|uniref:Transthyretin-like family domain-containing protein n=1 Tax=Ditylenchus destructor TaxID=166010 RepID=A0AAD4MDS5_9BILA|nr:transthyretin-like family domain-containing protein [Ditylenchus destructor]